MDFFEVALVSSILTVFPILLYFIYLIYNYDFDKKANELILDLCLITSFYLSYKIESSNVSYFLIFIPLLISYLKKRNIPIFFIFALTISCSNLYLIISEILFYLLSKIIENKKIFIICFLIINFSTSILILINLYTFNTKILIKIVVESFLGLFITIFVIKLFDHFNKLINIYINLNEIKKNDKIQESLFKITHEIKNPIAVCKGYLDMYDINNIEHSRKYIPIIKEEIERTLVLLKDFLSLRKIKLDKEEIDLTLLFDETIEEMSLCKEPDIKYMKKYDDEVYVLGDYNRLKQVIINIFKNSSEAILKKGTIIVEIINEEDISIKITDNGMGMDEETLKKINEPFFTTKNNGTGLGVPLLIEIIEAHGWTIRYNSELGNGTTVTINIPSQEKSKINFWKSYFFIPFH